MFKPIIPGCTSKWLLVMLVMWTPITNALNLNHAQNTGEVERMEGRIAGGELAAQNQFPYQVGLNIEISSGRFTWCGGSLISKQWILTAAHCVDSVVGVIAYLGSTYRLEPKITQRIPLQFIHLHEQYNPSTLENDIALLLLPSTLTLSDSISPIKLPKLYVAHSSYAYLEAIASGWGLENDVSNSISPYLRYVVRYTLSNDECKFIYGNSIRSSNICIDTTGGKSTCSGDSGGPLVIYDQQDGLIQIGLTSFGKSSGCTNGNPAVFTRLTSYLNWIYQISGIANIV